MKIILPLLILFAGFTVSSCSPSSGSPSGGSGDVAQSGASLFNAHCATCHGGSGAGSPMGLGPSLHGLAEHWEAGSLEVYLSDPPGYADSVERLGSRPMPSWPKRLSAEERAALVDHALGLMR